MLMNLLFAALGFAAACALCAFYPDVLLRWWDTSSKKISGWLDR